MKNFVIAPIRFYQKNISPLTPPSCRFYPTCSNYAIEAIEKHGAIKGGTMGFARVLRCNPFVEGGIDQVPDYFTLRRNPENIGQNYVPGQFSELNQETEQELNRLIDRYGDQLKISDKLPNADKVIKKIADVEKMEDKDFQRDFSKEEFEFLKDIEIIPEYPSEQFMYYTLRESSKNKKYLQEIQDFDVDIKFGKDYPLIALEDTGIWYTNMPILNRYFLLERGVTASDVEERSYYLWMVLKAIEASNNK